MDDKKYFYTWKNFEEDVKKLASELKRRRPASGWDGIWAPPRGGLPIAVCLSHSLNLPFLEKPESEKNLIVDDIADTHTMLEPFSKKGHTIATICYLRGSRFEPHIWLREKKDEWIVFPWEKI